MYQVYLVESDRHLNHLLSLYMQKEGWEITSFTTGEKALKYIEKEPHLWVINNSLSDLDGFQVMTEIKDKFPHLPVLMMSERGSSMDRVIGLEMGCDDYLAKPFLPKELVIRSKRMLGRTYTSMKQKSQTRLIRIESYMINETERSVMLDSEMVNLTSKEFDMVIMFAKNPFRVFSREQIIRFVWGEEHFGSSRSVDDLVRRVRKKMKYLRIETVYGYGYRLLASSEMRSEHIS